MNKPKTVKAYLKMCLAIADTDRSDLKGINNLTEEEYNTLGAIRASIQNDLGDNDELLEKHKLKYNAR